MLNGQNKRRIRRNLCWLSAALVFMNVGARIIRAFHLDQCDLGRFVSLLNECGPNVAYPLPWIDPCDLDEDGDVDLGDFALFQTEIDKKDQLPY